jgi:hypothetical protein
MTTSRTIQDPSRRTEGATRSVYWGNPTRAIAVPTHLSVLLLAVLMGCNDSPTSPTAATVGPALAQAQRGTPAANRQVPFKGSVQAHETYDLQFPTLFVDAIGTGTATHLGRFTVTYQVEVDLVTGGGPASIVLVAANRDAIFATGSGQGSPTEDPDIASIVETYTITGGTGRFAGAAGSFTVQRLVNLVTGITSGSFDGTIVIH